MFQVRYTYLSHALAEVDIRKDKTLLNLRCHRKKTTDIQMVVAHFIPENFGRSLVRHHQETKIDEKGWGSSFAHFSFKETPVMVRYSLEADNHYVKKVIIGVEDAPKKAVVLHFKKDPANSFVSIISKISLQDAPDFF